jgi:hypothetical protein
MDDRIINAPLVRIGEPCPDGPHRHTSSLHQVECDIERDIRKKDLMKNEFTVDELKTIRYIISLHMHSLREWDKEGDPYYVELEKIISKIRRNLKGFDD